MNDTKLVKLKTNPQPGYIYLVNAVGTDKFKIGKTAVCVTQRIKQLQTGSHVQLRYVYHAYVENMNLCEMELHRKFADKRQIGEWFKLMPIDVNECIELMRLVHQENLTLEDLNNKIGFPQNHVEGKLIIQRPFDYSSMERACLKLSPEQHLFFVARHYEFTSETEDGIYHCIGLEKHKQIQNLILDDIKVRISMVRLITLLGYAEKTNDVFALAYTFRPGWNQVCGYFDYSNNKYWY